ncbi:MAG: hypothetical protein HKN03_01850 [Acidimicrobiales bacterium]|nr:hypothetical protein [Acidimicrobiales bacterium]
MKNQVVLVPARAADADGIWELLRDAVDETIGMTALPDSPQSTQELCDHSAKTLAQLATGSFQLADGEHRRLLFLAIDSVTRTPLGISGVTFKQSVPDLSVRVGTSPDGLGLVMRSSSEPWTRTELNSSFLGVDARGRRVGTLLSRGRLVFLNLIRSQIPTTISSHLRGRVDADGHAPFWDRFGSNFAPHWKTSIDAELGLIADPSQLKALAGHTLPLTAPVLESLGPVNAASLPAFHLLISEGLEPNGRYDPIDGGPTLIASIDQLTTKKTHRHAPAQIITNEKARTEGRDALVSVTSVAEFRVTRCHAVIDDPAIGIAAEALTALGATEGTLLAASQLERPA